jgi:hypothetical protein
MPKIHFGQVPKPPVLEMICPKPFEGAGFYRVPPRQNVGLVDHITGGRGSLEWYRDFFSTGGERATDALVDFVIDRDGRIGMLNDPNGTRAGWANGDVAGLEGDGPAFVQRLGVFAVNAKLESCEHVGTPADSYDGPLYASSVALKAWRFDVMRIPYDRFPVNPATGLTCHYWHSEYTGKGANQPSECPGRKIKEKVQRVHADIRAILEEHQTGNPPSAPGAGALPPPPEFPYPAGMSYAEARAFFGTGIRYDRDGAEIGKAAFDPKGVVSNAWLARGKEERAYPRLVELRERADGGAYARFANGWVLVRPAASRAGWFWLGKDDVLAAAA